MKVAVWGATGIVGQRYAQLLANHPWFELAYAAASERSVGKPFGHLTLQRLDPFDPALDECELLFSCAGTPEDENIVASRGINVITHLAEQRKRSDVPLVIPEINGHLLEQLPEKGWIVAKPNCSIQSYLLALYALPRAKRVHVTTLQGLSGGGVGALGMRENVIPYIAGEEEKCEWEPSKILGESSPAFSVQCNRVPVIDGHLACVSVEFEERPTREEIIERWRAFPSLDLPTAPNQTIYYFEQPDRPQPQLDANTDGGMAICVGRLRPCPLFDYRFVGLSHNAIRGAAGGGLLIAEQIASSKLSGRRPSLQPA